LDNPNIALESQRLALGIRYDGHDFEGWQTQPHGKTVQDTLSRSLSKIAGFVPVLFCAGRTDSGVHARQQVVHFDTPYARPLSAWVYGVNNSLPSSICVTGVKQVSEQFHARFCAYSRTYRYYFYSAKTPDPFKRFMTWVHYPLNLDAMQSAAHGLLGTHDFSAFRASQCQAKTPIKTLACFDLVQEQDFAYFEIRGNAFLHHMVRNLVGSLMEIGLGRKPIDWISEVLISKDRAKAAKTYPSKGLTLWQVDYPPEYEINTLFDSSPLVLE
jgi:tRNA pseudouridine38-40 synthase